MFEVFPGYNATPMTELAMQQPMFYFSAPQALDFNNDGVLDLWHHNHYAFSGLESRWSDPAVEKKGNLEKAPGGCMVDWDAVLRDGDTGAYYAANDGKGFIDWADIKFGRYCHDVHSTSFLDIDGDGYKDLFLVTGGGGGVGNSYETDNLLFWGVPDSSSLGYRLVGGREAGLAAGLNGRTKLGNERGRHQYWLDVNNDGLLDVLFLNDERADDAIIPSNLYRNLGGRKFQKVNPKGEGFDEFASMALLTDVDGDGLARELVVPSHCAKRRNGSGPPLNYVCTRAPRSSISIFKLDSDSDSLMVRASVTPSFSKRNKAARGMATGDFDFDGMADVAILWSKTVSIHLSSARQKRCQRIKDAKKHQTCLLTLGQPDANLNLKSQCGNSGGSNIRLADFNLDGRIDMLVTCDDPGKHGIYELLPSGSWQEMLKKNGRKMSFGKLNSDDSMLGPKGYCKGVPTTNKILSNSKKCTKFFSSRQCKNVQNSLQFAICNDRANGVRPRAIGATVADCDNDGYSDLIIGHRFGSAVMFRNTLRQSGYRRFIAVRLDRTAGAAASIGAIVTATTSRMGPKLNEVTSQMRVISTLSHETDASGGTDDRLIFGLGKRGKLTKLTIQWPHCCKPTVIKGNAIKAWQHYNKMDSPYEVPAPKNCDRSCLKS